MRVAGDDLHLHGEYLRNCWYVAAWSHELIDGKLLARSTTAAATAARACRKAGSKATACAACTTA
jgi:hypothetical protein